MSQRKTSTSKGGGGEEFIRRFRTKLTFLFAQSHQNAVVEYVEKILKVITLPTFCSGANNDKVIYSFTRR